MDFGRLDEERDVVGKRIIFEVVGRGKHAAPSQARRPAAIAIGRRYFLATVSYGVARQGGALTIVGNPLDFIRMGEKMTDLLGALLRCVEGHDIIIDVEKFAQAFTPIRYQTRPYSGHFETSDVADIGVLIAMDVEYQFDSASSL